MLLYALAKEAEAVYNSFVYDRADEEEEEAGGHPSELDYETVMEKFSDHLVPKRNVIHDRACFHMRVQKPGEPVEAFLRGLYELAQYSDFKGTKDEQIRDRIVIGISDNEVSQKLQLKLDLSLERAIKIACQSEQIKQQNVSLRADCAVDAVRQGRRQFHAKKSDNDGQQKQEQGEQKNPVACSRCARPHGKNNPVQLRIRGVKSVQKLDISKQPVKQKC